MDKIISTSLEVEESTADTQPSDGIFWVDTRNTREKSRPLGLTTIVYDGEIGLWEELEHRNRLADSQSK